MSSRDAILAAVRRNLPRPAVPLPAIPGTDRKGIAAGFGYKEHFNRLPEVSGFPDEGEPILPYFQKQLEAMGGRSFHVQDAAAARAKVVELFPAARVVCSAVPEVPGTRQVENVRDPHELNDVDVGMVRSPLGVAEAGAVWLTQEELVVNALGVLSQHLIVLLDPAAIVDTMHDAYGRLDLSRQPLWRLPGGAVGHRRHRGGDYPRGAGSAEPDRAVSRAGRERKPIMTQAAVVEAVERNSFRSGLMKNGMNSVLRHHPSSGISGSPSGFSAKIHSLIGSPSTRCSCTNCGTLSAVMP